MSLCPPKRLWTVVRVLTEEGEVLRHLVIDPACDYERQPAWCFDVPRHQMRPQR